MTSSRTRTLLATFVPLFMLLVAALGGVAYGAAAEASQGKAQKPAATAETAETRDSGKTSNPAADNRTKNQTTDPAADNRKNNSQTDGGTETNEITEDNDNNDGGTPNNVVDDGDNAHPSGKDRSVEPGNSGNQGNASSDPDDDGNGPDRSNGGADQPGGPGGVDPADQDGNNGCGNDDDFEDDNEGLCRPAQSPQVPVDQPTDEPTDKPTDKPTDTPTDEPTDEPTETGIVPTDEPTFGATENPVAGVIATEGPVDETVQPTAGDNAVPVEIVGETPRPLPQQAVLAAVPAPSGGNNELAATGSKAVFLLAAAVLGLLMGAVLLRAAVRTPVKVPANRSRN